MKVTMAECRARLKEVLDAAEGGEHVVVTRDGKAVAGVVHAWEMGMLEALTTEEWEALRERAGVVVEVQVVPIKRDGEAR